MNQPPSAKLTKQELIEELSRVLELPRHEAQVVLEAIFNSITRALKAGDKVEIRGFGSFRTRERRPRIGRNPKTGAAVAVAAKRIPYFKPSKDLKELIEPKSAESKPVEAAGVESLPAHRST